MKMMMIYLMFFMFFVGFMSFFFNSNYLLLMLLVMEFIFLSLYFSLFFSLSLYFIEQYFVMVYLTFMVCESVLGLSLMLMMVRSYGSDYFQILSLLW
uniref:NADH-ubiquinone oxidoreductase chain 4L n=1 Tax=Phrixothrix hirtus TaxID=94779 RepID=A0A0R6CNT7_PHRHR|nr:NADH dehydrogenase subunit 4L [Phrixothrix hirtus]